MDFKVLPRRELTLGADGDGLDLGQIERKAAAHVCESGADGHTRIVEVHRLGAEPAESLALSERLKRNGPLSLDRTGDEDQGDEIVVLTASLHECSGADPLTKTFSESSEQKERQPTAHLSSVRHLPPTTSCSHHGPTFDSRVSHVFRDDGFWRRRRAFRAFSRQSDWRGRT